jgi:hypothetical protein
MPSNSDLSCATSPRMVCNGIRDDLGDAGVTRIAAPDRKPESQFPRYLTRLWPCPFQAVPANLPDALSCAGYCYREGQLRVLTAKVN